MNLIALIIALLTAITGSFGAIYLKKGSASFNLSILSILRNKNLITGGLLYLISLIVFIFALKLEKVSLLYPIVATAYIWVSLLSIFMLKEHMSKLKWIGIFFIVLGVSLIGFS